MTKVFIILFRYLISQNKVNEDTTGPIFHSYRVYTGHQSGRRRRGGWRHTVSNMIYTLYSHKIARSTLYYHTISRSTLYFHTISRSTLYFHTISRSTLYFHTISRSTLYFHTRWYYILISTLYSQTRWYFTSEVTFLYNNMS
jgi:hypothetical protein